MEKLLVLIFLVFLAFGYNNGVSKLPPMGFNPWSVFWCQTDCKKYPDACIGEKLFIEIIDQMVNLGLRDKGYNTFNFDDCWQSKERDPKTGKLVPDPERFPHGVRYLSDYLTKNDMSFGIYSDVGTKTCGGYPAGEGHESIDVETFVNDWNVTYLKLDGCYLSVSEMKEKYTLWSQLLNKTGVHVVFSCSWPAYEKVHYSVVPYVASICNLWRFYNDVRPTWESVYDILTYVGDKQKEYIPSSKPYSHNDPDMLCVGQTKSMKIEVQRTQMAMWSIMAAPLLISSDLRTISNESLQLFLHEEVIAIDQDPLVIQGQRIWKKGYQEIWLKPLSGTNTYAIAMINSGLLNQQIKANWSELGIPGDTYHVRDVWLRQDEGKFKDSFSATVFPHDTQLFVIKKM